MKDKIHPDYHPITVRARDNSFSFETRSTWGKSNDVLILDIYPSIHPAWTGAKRGASQTDTNIGKFNKRYGGFKSILADSIAEQSNTNENDANG